MKLPRKVDLNGAMKEWIHQLLYLAETNTIINQFIFRIDKSSRQTYDNNALWSFTLRTYIITRLYCNFICYYNLRLYGLITWLILNYENSKEI